MNYFQKYLKYKNKYLSFRQIAGSRASKSAKADLYQAIKNFYRDPDEKNIGRHIETILRLITPDSAKNRNRRGMLPLHVIIYMSTKKNNAIIDIVRKLVSDYPESVKEIYLSGDLPLHIAIMYKAPIEVVSILLSSYPDGSKFIANEKLPIHLAASVNASIDVIRILLSAYPESVRKHTKKN